MTFHPPPTRTNHRQRTTLDTLIALLELYPDVNCPAALTDRLRVSDSYTSPSVMMDPLYHAGTFRELEESLRWMRNQAKQQAYRGVSVGVLRWHVRKWWIELEMVQRRVVVRRLRVKGGRLVEEFGWRMVPVRDPQVREQKALWGAEWIDLQWPLLAARAEAEGRAFRRVPQLPPDELKAVA